MDDISCEKENLDTKNPRRSERVRKPKAPVDWTEIVNKHVIYRPTQSLREEKNSFQEG